MVSSSESYFERTGEHTFRPTHWTSGAWRETEQHFSPIGGLIVHAIEQHIAQRDGEREVRQDLALARLSFDILGVVRLEEMEIRVHTLRPGRTIELLEAVVTWGERTVVIGRAWRLVVTDTASVAGGEHASLPAPDSIAPWELASVWRGDYIRSLDVRPVDGPHAGRGTAWLRTDVDLVAGETSSDLARFVGLVDTANGICVRVPPGTWLYPNVDLGIHLHRQPRGPWVGLDTRVVFGPTGQGVTSTVLHDEQGPVGRAEQTLTIRPIG